MNVRALALVLLMSLAWSPACTPRRVSVPPALPPPPSEAKPELVCSYTYGGESKRLSVRVARDPYNVRAQNVSDRFEFKVVYVDAPADVAGVRVYTYALGTGAPVLIHEAKFGLSHPNLGRYGFTGQQLLYEPSGREFQYYCAWIPP